MNDSKKLVEALKNFEQEHRDLDEVLIQLQEKKTVDFLQIQRLKKRKLILKDKINDIKNRLEPDIIA
tara:strand:- start:313 stop:513 length:201 start_codon:yes stop_codon:yes gene_type:complete